ncbi:MAG: LiaI-LiaF-like domain-containing protein [Terriglobales bacterium]|jgi:TM2 domain-containing membrane protein YozV
MNCANHADASAVAYCRTCGKALCANCTRPVRGVIYCEDCLGAKMEGVPTGSAAAPSGYPSGGVPPAAFAAPTLRPVASPLPAGTSGGPNPTVAGILAGFFPFGVGAVYTGQYAKGLAHLAIFALLIGGISSSDHGHGEALGVICGLGISFFYIYQIIDSVRSARAIQMAQPAPDPFGLAATFGGGSRVETNRIPMGAIILILLGVLFLLHTMGFGLDLDRFWPVILIFLGGWLFARNWGWMGARDPAVIREKMASRGLPVSAQNVVVAAGCCPCARCRMRRIMGPAMLLTIGILFLIDNLNGPNFSHTWPVILLVIGGIKLLQGSASTEGHTPITFGATSPGAGGPNPPVPPVPPVPPTAAPPTSEVNRG